MVDEPQGRILVLDDEPMVVKTMGSLIELESPWQMVGFTDPQAAVGALRETEFDVVLSDFLMPELDGVEVLTRARELQPLASRILLTGYADKRNAIRSINEAGLYHYVEKPWDNGGLLLVLRNAVERARLLRRLDEHVRGLAEKDRSLAELRARLFKALL